MPLRIATPAVWLRKTLLAWAGVLVLLSCLTSPAAAEAPDAPCLSAHVGELLSAKVAAHAFDGALPPDWTLREVSVARDHIDLGTLDGAGQPRGVGLWLHAEGAKIPDGRGRWFAFVIDRGSGGLDEGGRRGLLDLAARVDAIVPEEEALRVCASGASIPPGRGTWVEGGGALPRWVALTVALLEMLVVVGALLFARRPGRNGRHVWLDLAVFVLAWLAIHAWSGSSPMLWLDTINDQRDVRQCLTQGACTSLGEATSVDGIHHAVGWLDFLSFAAFLGVGIGPLYVVFQALAALGVMLTGSAARRAWGSSAGVFAALVCLGFVVRAANQQVVYNTTILPFLGAVFLVVGVAAARRPGPGSIALTALVGALLASVHAACVVSVVSVVWIALLAPRHRVRLAALGVAVFVGAAFAIGPAAWMSSARHLLLATMGARAGHRVSTGAGHGEPESYGTLIALGVVARLITPRRQRALVEVALASALPMLAASFVAAAASTIPTNAKYLAHAVPAGAVLVVALVTSAAALIASVLGRKWNSPSGGARVVGVVLYGAVAIHGFRRFLAPMLDGLRRHSLSFAEAAAIPRELAARGWTYSQLYRALRAPDSAELLASLEMVAPAFPVGPGTDESTLVYVAKVKSTELPSPLPKRWVVASQDGDSAVLLVFARSFLSWTHFAACDPRVEVGRSPCADSGLALRDDMKPDCVYCVPGMPPFQSQGRRTLELRMSVQAPAGEPHRIVMPRAPSPLCKGTIGSVPAGPAAISADHRRATWIEPANADAPEEVTLEWDIGSAECETNDYSGRPPFFLEGDPQTVDALERLHF